MERGTLEEKKLKPQVEKDVKQVEVHGEVRKDEFFWLRERENPEVMRYLAAENEYTKKEMQHTEELQEKLFEEMKSRIKQDDESVPERIDGYFYYIRLEKDKQYWVRCRKRAEEGAQEEIVLDENELAEGQSYFNLGNFETSFDQRFLAYAVDTVGSENFTIYIKDLASGEHLPEQIHGAAPLIEWSNDNKTLYYVLLDESSRPYKLLSHVIGTDPAEDKLLYHETDEVYHLDLSKTKSEKYILLRSASILTSEVYYIDADNPTDEPHVVYPREYGMDYSLVHQEDRFLIRTNWNAQNFRVMEAPLGTSHKENWKEIVSHNENVFIEGIDSFKNHLVLFERENGLEKIHIIRTSDSDEHWIEFPDPVYTFSPHANPEYTSNLLRFSYSSLVFPNSIYDYDMDARTWDLKKRDEIPSGYDPSEYTSERIYAEAKDGVKIPISLVYKKSFPKPRPLFLYGYGAYGSSIDPRFSRTRLSLLERGFVYAIAHVRGGQELGRAWYEDGKLLKKKNTFTDFIACAEYLIERGYTTRDQLVAHGESAGGLLMGVVANMRPDLFHIVVADVPFVDALNTMLDPSLPLTVTEYEEWGNPEEKEYYDYIKSYSPYDNILPQAYPHMLVMASLNDTRVQYWEPAKWVARLRSLKQDSNRLLMRLNMDAGHAGASGRYEFLREAAFEYAFIFDTMGIEE